MVVSSLDVLGLLVGDDRRIDRKGMVLPPLELPGKCGSRWIGLRSESGQAGSSENVST
jgi:hypothetical protein